MDSCIFCKIGAHEIPAHTIWEDDFYIAFLDLRPVNPGHLLIVPKLHIPYVFDMAGPDYTELFQVAKKIAGPLREATGCKRVGLSIEGFGVDHAHVHLIPLNQANEMNPERAREMLQKELEKMAKTIKNHL